MQKKSGCDKPNIFESRRGTQTVGSLINIDNAASSKTQCQYISTGRGLLKFDYFSNRLKLVLVISKNFWRPKRYAFCNKLDFQNTSYVVACFRVAHGT